MPRRPLVRTLLAVLPLLAAADAGAQQVYVSARDLAQGTSQLGRFDLLTGSYTFVAATTRWYGALTAGADGYLYGLSSAQTLDRIDATTGAVTTVGTPTVGFTGLARDGAALLGKSNGTTSALYTVDPATAAVSNPRGALGSADQSDNLERAADGTLYYGGQLDGNGNSWALYTLDGVTGARTLVGSVTPYREVRGLSDGGSTTRLYGFGACPAGTPTGRNCVLEIDRTTGAITGTARSTGLLVISAAGAPGGTPTSTVPEPTTVALLGGGLLLLGLAKRRQD